MKRIIMLSTLVATMVVMLALGGSASAANPPETERFVDEGTDFFFADCGGFDVLSDFTVDGVITTFYDRAGNPDYAKVHLVFHDFFYNSEKPGEGFAETNAVNDVIDLPSELEESASGVQYHVTVPGEGLVLIGAGRLVFDEAETVVFEGGPHQLLSGDTEKLCKALA